MDSEYGYKYIVNGFCSIPDDKGASPSVSLDDQRIDPNDQDFVVYNRAVEIVGSLRLQLDDSQKKSLTRAKSMVEKGIGYECFGNEGSKDRFNYKFKVLQSKDKLYMR